MKENKMLKYFFGTLLLLVIFFIAYNLFSFEPDRNNKNTNLAINDELVNDLNGYLITDKNNKQYTMYNQYYVSAKNLSPNVIFSLIYNYLNNMKSYKLITISDEEANSIEQVSNYKVIYKIDVNDFREAYKEIFDGEYNYQYTDFTNNDIMGKFLNDGYLYIYKQINVEKDSYTIKKMIDSYMISDNGHELTIYEYFVKCSNVDNTCYSDDELNIVNYNVKLVNGEIQINDMKDIVKYKHIYRNDNNNFYWVSSELESK